MDQPHKQQNVYVDSLCVLPIKHAIKLNNNVLTQLSQHAQEMFCLKHLVNAEQARQFAKLEINARQLIVNVLTYLFARRRMDQPKLSAFALKLRLDHQLS
jgi:hypothetical protein